MNKRKSYLILWLFIIAVVTLIAVPILYVGYVDSVIEGTISRVENGMTCEQVLNELGEPAAVGAYKLTDGEGESHGVYFEYHFPYIWDYLAWSRQKVYTSMREPYIEKAAKVQISFDSDKLKVVEVGKTTRGSTTTRVFIRDDYDSCFEDLSIATQKDIDLPFFPEKAFSNDAEENVLALIWFRKHLKRLKGPSIYRARHDQDKQIFRLIWLTTYQSSITIKLEVLADGSADLSLRCLDLTGKFKSQELRRILTKEEVNEFVSLMNESDFWNLNHMIEEGKYDPVWAIEGLVDGKYNLLASTAGRESKARDIGLKFLRLWNFEPEEMF